MAALPDDVAATLVRAVGAYIRAAPAAELPPKLKRFKRFDRPRSLAPHKDALLEVVDTDELTRARISEWMADGRPSLTKDEREVLGLAVERPDGWADQLASMAAPVVKKQAPRAAPADLSEEIARAKERTAKAKEETRRVRGEAREEARVAQANVARLEKDIGDARAEIASLRARVADAERRARASEQAAERVERKSRAAAERAAAKEKAARDELRAVRRELRHAKERIQRDSSARARPRATTATPRRSARRRRLTAPKGRLETDPETLDEWLGVEGVHLLVDGYNVTKAEGGFGDVDLELQRRRLIEGVGKLARKKEVGATIVFDGSAIAPGTSRRSRGPVAVEYSRPGEIADDHLIARLESSTGGPVIVATNDKELQHRAAALGATVATSHQLLALIR